MYIRQLLQGTGIAVLALLLAGIQQAAAKDVKDVVIVDQQGALDVNIVGVDASAGSVPVTVGNAVGIDAENNTVQVDTSVAPLSVTDVDNPALQPFQHEIVDLEGSNFNGSFTVPVGKRLVIEFVSAHIALAQGEPAIFTVVTTVNDVTAAHRLLVTPQAPSGGFPMSWNVSQNVRLYADPGTNVAINIITTLGGDGVLFSSISGYLIDVF